MISEASPLLGCNLATRVVGSQCFASEENPPLGLKCNLLHYL